jgi:hypothetical protein
VQYYHQTSRCQNCACSIEQKVQLSSVIWFSVALCTTCQESIGEKIRATTRETSKLYFGLKKRGVAVHLELLDGHDTMDIAIDDPQISYNPKEALAALKQTFLSFRSEDKVLHIPNALVAYNLEETVDYISEFVRSRRRMSYR